MEQSPADHPAQTIKRLIQETNQAQQIPAAAASYLEGLTTNTENLSKHLAEHWKETLNLVLALLARHPQVYHSKEETKLNSALVSLNDGLLNGSNSQELYDHLVDKLSPDIETPCQLFLLNLLIDLSLKGNVKVLWQRQLPLQIRTAGLILHKYLKLKKQKSSGSTDRLPADIVIEKHSEKWIEELFISSINKYKTLLNKDATLRRYFINFGCDLSEALLQSFLESEINKQVITYLLIEVSRVFIEEYSVAELSRAFSETLHQNKMITPVKPIQIVEVYTPQLLINPNGFNYLLKSILSQPHIPSIFSQQTIVRGLLPILGQSIKRQLPIKHDILDLAEKIISQTKIQAKSDDELGYPISLLITNLIISKQNQSEFTNLKIQKLLQVFLTWKWSLNRCLDFSNNIRIKKFVLEQINQSGSLNNYFILNTLEPIEAEKEFTDLYVNTLFKLKGKEKEYPWAANLLKQKKKYVVVEDRFRQ